MAVSAAALAPRLTQRSITAASWGIAGSALRVVLQMGAQIVLARILGPEEYGVFAVGVLVVTLALFFSDIGIAYGLIQRRELDDRDIRFVFTWQFIFGSAVSVLIFATAPLVSAWMLQPRAGPLLMLLSIVCLLNALSAPAMNLLKRKLDYFSLQLAQVISYVVGYVFVGIPMAMAGAGVDSLAYAWITLSVVQFAFLYWRTRHPVMPLVWFEHAGAHLRFGGIVLATNLVNWFVTNIDKAIAARFFPGAGVGLYSTSYTLLNTPTTVLYSTVQSVVLSAAARLQDQQEALKRGYLKLLGLFAAVFIPAFVTLSVVADTLVLALYGDRWSGAAPLVTAFACAMPLMLFWGISTPILWNTGRASREMLIQLPIAALWIGAALVAASYSVTALAWAMSACLLVRVAVVCIYVWRILGLRASELRQAFVGPLVGTLIVSIVVFGADFALKSLGVHALARLLADALVGGVVLCVLLRFAAAAMSAPARGLIGESIRKVPSRVRPLLEVIARGPQ